MKRVSSGAVAALFAAMVPSCGKAQSGENRTIKIDGASGLAPITIPLALCGSVVKGRPTFNVLGNVGLVSLGPPPAFYISSKGSHYTNIGINDNNQFSLNFPDKVLVPRVDYCGTHSGHNTDKSGVFKTFFGALKNAPLVSECPLCFSCKVVQRHVIHDMEIFFGEVEEQYAMGNCFINGRPNIDLAKPFLFSLDGKYRESGTVVGNAYGAYKKYKS